MQNILNSNLKELQQIDLSIIIVSWNTKDLLVACLDSLSVQKSIYNIEVIVVDNASTDGSVEIVNEFYCHVNLIKNNTNMGFGMANNIGIKHSSGRYICLINSDVRVLPGCLDSLVNYMDQDKSIGIIGPKTLSPDMSLQDTCRKLPNLWNNICEFLYLNRLFPKSNILSGEHMMFFDHMTIRGVQGLAGCFLMIRKDALKQIGLFDERFFIYFEETDLCKRFLDKHYKILFFPHATIIHHHGASSSKDPLRFSAEQIKSRIKYWKKHHSIFAVTFLLFILLMHYSLRLIGLCILYFLAPSMRSQTVQQLSQTNKYLKYILIQK